MERAHRRFFGRDPRLGHIEVEGERLDEHMARVDAEFRARRRFFDDGVIADTRWRGWRLDPAKYTLPLVDNDGTINYEIDLLTCWHSAGLLDWIVQVSGKQWRDFSTDEVTLGLLYAADDVLQLQATLCSFGKHLTLTEQQIRDRVTTFVQQFHEGEQP